METTGLDILYEDGPILVINKWPGILTQAPPGIDSLEVRIKAYLRERDGILGDVYLAIIHRLDRPASGALVFASQRLAAKRLSLQFEHRRVAKTYWAFVEGAVTPEEGTWTDYIYKVHGVSQARIVPADFPGGKLAVLHYWVRFSNEQGTWLEIELETGRTHQIRIQAASRGHPVLGDVQYKAVCPFGPQHADERLRAIALHAQSLAFTHPITRESVAITAPTPAAWKDLELG
ncbi:MAG: RluA family pseudouridine synthase [Pirellulales bacterium]|nr:RluA family pseudouridine synthase [Pirellulales bacterium]